MRRGFKNNRIFHLSPLCAMGLQRRRPQLAKDASVDTTRAFMK